MLVPLMIYSRMQKIKIIINYELVNFLSNEYGDDKRNIKISILSASACGRIDHYDL
jgi:hypothetical protein